MLSSGSVGEIAEKLGYADQFTFSRQFKKRTDYSPREYRKGSEVLNLGPVHDAGQ